MTSKNFKNNIFINCPYDDSYLPLLRPLLFCILYLNFNPRMALERLNGAEPRIDKIYSLIKESKYGIHDLSRLKAEKAGEIFRLNMPFELGLDIGCRKFKEGKWKRKKCLILTKEKFKYQAALSDIAGSDNRVHSNKPERIVIAVRNWLNNEEKLDAPGAKHIWNKFHDFMGDNYDELRKRKFSKKEIENLEISELMRYMRRWIKNHHMSSDN